jgi:hypothetical protein
MSLAKEAKKRCWKGYEPVPGKKPYSEDSCRKKKTLVKQAFESFDTHPEQDGGATQREDFHGHDYHTHRLSKSQWKKFQEHTKQASEKPFHGYNPKVHARTGGLSAAGRAKFKREEGANLKAPVTEKNPSGDRAKRRKSFCARMSGVPGPTSKDGKLTRKGAALKRWRC